MHTNRIFGIVDNWTFLPLNRLSSIFSMLCKISLTDFAKVSRNFSVSNVVCSSGVPRICSLVNTAPCSSSLKNMCRRTFPSTFFACKCMVPFLSFLNRRKPSPNLNAVIFDGTLSNSFSALKLCCKDCLRDYFKIVLQIEKRGTVAFRRNRYSQPQYVFSLVNLVSKPQLGRYGKLKLGNQSEK